MKINFRKWCNTHAENRANEILMKAEQNAKTIRIQTNTYVDDVLSKTQEKLRDLITMLDNNRSELRKYQEKYGKSYRYITCWWVFYIRSFGVLDSNVNIISKEFNVDIKCTNEGLSIYGNKDSVESCVKVLELLISDKSNNISFDLQRINYIIEKVKTENLDNLVDYLDYTICLNTKLKPIKPKTLVKEIMLNLLKIML